MSTRIPDIKKIAVLRANGIGDFLFALPALEALRAAYPAAGIVLLGLPWHERFLSGRPSPVDRVVVVPFARGVREEAGQAEEACALARFFSRMEEERFDIAFQMHGGGRYSNPFVLRMKARMTAGLRTPDAAALDLWVPYVYFQPEIMRYLEVAALAGAEAVTFEPRIAPTEADGEESLAALPETADRLVALICGAGDGRRRWPPEKFAALGDYLAARGARIVMPGIAPEAAFIGRVAALMKERADVLCGRFSLGGLVGLLARCALAAGNDSGPLHLAYALGVPTVGIYWCGNVFTAGPLTRKRHRPLLSWRLQCPTCGTNCIEGRCDHHDSFVADVALDDVCREVSDLLDNPP